jgi:hypothetical protein
LTPSLVNLPRDHRFGVCRRGEDLCRAPHKASQYTVCELRSSSGSTHHNRPRVRVPFRGAHDNQDDRGGAHRSADSPCDRPLLPPQLANWETRPAAPLSTRAAAFCTSSAQPERAAPWTEQNGTSLNVCIMRRRTSRTPAPFMRASALAMRPLYISLTPLRRRTVPRSAPERPPCPRRPWLFLALAFFQVLVFARYVPRPSPNHTSHQHSTRVHHRSRHNQPYPR